MNSACETTLPAAARAGRTLPRIPGLFTLVALWQSRRALARLDASRLDDIGVSPETASHEAQRPFWDVPANWRR